jgi:pyridinium-3,5-biscarboxylic acid mononucleotide synthase
VTQDYRLDLDRRRRLGMVEAVWGEHKSPAQIAAICDRLIGAGEVVLVTRVDAAKAAEVAVLLEGTGGRQPLRYDATARCLASLPLPATDPERGRVLVLAGGTSDLTVASEAQLALACHGLEAELLLDVGVAGLHRLLGQLEHLAGADVLIACAGMEGALPTVLAGLVPQPVIGVPVSVGYGVSAGGMAALHGMLASCAPGLSVVNIDNGYGAAMAALRILGLRGDRPLRGAADPDRW